MKMRCVLLILMAMVPLGTSDSPSETCLTIATDPSEGPDLGDLGWEPEPTIGGSGVPAALCVPEEIQYLQCLDGGIGDTAGLGPVPEVDGISEWSIGALINEDCITAIASPMVPLYADIGHVSDAWSIERSGDDECQLVDTTANNDWRAEFYLHVSISTEATYSGKLPFDHGQSTIEFDLPGASTNLGPFVAWGENAGGTGGSGKMLCEGNLKAEEGRAYSEAYEWLADQYAKISEESLDGRGQISLVQMADGGHLITTPWMDGTCALVQDPFVSWEFDCWFTLEADDIIKPDGWDRAGPAEIVVHATGASFVFSPNTIEEVAQLA